MLLIGLVLYFAFLVIIIVQLYGVFSIVLTKTSTESYIDSYIDKVNMNFLKSTAYKWYTITIIIYGLLWFISTFAAAVLPAVGIMWIVVQLVAYWWLYETYKKGYVTKFYNHISSKFKN